jgi:UDP-4-amino-4,6-dideoxy-N-acetyl-beta-L-altrosamine N-acetyltransferase
MSLRKAEESDLDQILKWRNQKVNRKVMFTSHLISQEEHLAWWENASIDEKRIVLIFEFEGLECGVVNFFDIDVATKSAHWGFFLNSDELTKKDLLFRAWSKLESDTIVYAKAILGVERLICETLEKNKAVLAMHEKFGFNRISTYDDTSENESKRTVRMEMVFRSDDDIKDVAIKDFVVDVNSEREIFWFFGDSNWDIIRPTIEGELRSHLGPKTQVRVPSFGEWRTKIFDAKFFEAESGHIVFAQRIEDFQKNAMGILSINEIDSIKQGIMDYLEGLREFVRKYGGSVYILDFCPLKQIPYVQSNPFNSLVSEVNEKIAYLAKKFSNLSVVSYSQVLLRIGQRNSNPGSFWFLGRSPLSVQAGKELAVELARTLTVSQSKSVRLLITDLDDTFWGGTIGEVGVEGITIGGDYPGNVFTQYQLFLHELKENGLALAIASKNSEKIALEAIEAHPEIQLRIKDFASIQIGWNSKTESVIEISKELNIAFENIIFVDDSPYERDEIRARLPSVLVPELSDDVVARIDQIGSLVRMSFGSPTDEDRKRAERYLERKQRIGAESAFESRDAYLESLDTKVNISEMNQFSEGRVVQLVNKTNQFNFTTKRYNKNDLDKIKDSGGLVLAISVSDKFSDVEIVGVLILETQQEVLVIDSFLLSCRVLGRGIEQAVLSWVINHAYAAGKRTVKGLRIDSERNSPTIGVLESVGFEKLSNEEFIFQISSTQEYVSYVNGIQVLSDV